MPKRSFIAKRIIFDILNEVEVILTQEKAEQQQRNAQKINQLIYSKTNLACNFTVFHNTLFISPISDTKSF